MSDEKRLDSELDFRVIVSLTVALLVLVAVAFFLMWPLTISLRDAGIAQDAPPPVLPEARMPQPPPAPRLQPDPPEDMRQFLEGEQRELTTYGWTDESAEIARIPIERAMTLLVENGLPEATLASPGAAAPRSKPESIGLEE
jgi:hypothetical protein